jgi:hypothetical protein
MRTTQSRLFALAIAATLGSIPLATQTFAQQQSSPPGLSKTDWTTLTNERINIVKGALQLTPEQQKYWPAVEEAIRARAQMREQRLNDTEERLDHQPLSIDPIAFLHTRADALTQRGLSQVTKHIHHEHPHPLPLADQLGLASLWRAVRTFVSKSPYPTAPVQHALSFRARRIGRLLLFNRESCFRDAAS